MRNRVLCMLVCLLLLPITGLAASVRIVQIWDDVNDYNHLRPDSVPIKITSDAGELVVEDSDVHEIMGSGLKFEQSELPSSYTPSLHIIQNDDLTTAVFINRHTVAGSTVKIQNTLLTADLTITKEADMAADSDVFYFQVSLPEIYPYSTTSGAEGETFDLIPLHAGESATVSDIPVGTTYSVTEIDDPRYISTGQDASGIIEREGTEVIFSNFLITTSFMVHKQWEGTPKDSITLNLFADGEIVPDITFEKNGDTYTVSNLPKYAADGHEIVYSATEVYLNGYMTMYINKAPYANRIRAVYNGGTIINRETTIVAVKKKWIGVSEENQPPITFQLYQNGQPITWRQPEKNAAGWYIWRNLPKMKNGEEAKYTVKELPLEGYLIKYENVNSDVDDCALNAGTIINYRVPVTGDDYDLTLVLIILGVTGLMVCLLLLRQLKRR